MEYDEQYRPLYHFTPYFGWTNDPNGMVYHDGEWHLAFQSNPYGTTHSNMHWGNAVSRDLIHWENLPLIVAPDSLGAIFSGSSVVDKNNTAGFGKDAIVGIYTSAGRQQRQSIAWSNDRGRTFTKYEGNPVLSDPAHRDYRDPKVAWIGDKWVMSLATGEVITFYGSKDLKNWEKLSEFGRGIGSHAAVWECPDLLRMEYNGEEKWVLLVSINPGGPNGGSVTQYFIGDFDGTEFHADPLPYPLWIDWGVDNYAGVTFGNVEGRHVFMGWMSNWNYSNFVPTRYFRNAMTLPRELSLKHNGEHLFLASRPAAEVYAARKQQTEPVDVKVKGKALIGGLLEEFDGAYSIDMTLLPKGDKEYGFRLCNSLNEYVEFRFNPAEGTL
ncbi:MAG: glycoside hydrolase family 32 protein, partial [Tidjanibacter sp.]|nr:glycoside hydrolase family 32 protein [Tidjanibacter sp.]